ncbi:unnamed protein product [Medioppia subpectinata]|uniref:Purple acid phosphatase n=1 Tax=Medioppia subpectinata TaxID=1979941 RepID=A0A7R9KEF8_9ACAR|nr:unnamed protein product [Medioppia subpectinata]CAG2101836.1 unnamed protein product [Medioppia subpectinata]
MDSLESISNTVNTSSLNCRSYDHLFKLIIVGDSCVGKTSILQRFHGETYLPASVPTIGILQVKRNTTQLRHPIIEELSEYFSSMISRIGKNTRKGVKMVLIGNKCDLRSKREVNAEVAEALAIDYGLKHFETSAKENINLEKAFFQISKDIYNEKCLRDEANNVSLSPTTEPKKGKTYRTLKKVSQQKQIHIAIGDDLSQMVIIWSEKRQTNKTAVTYGVYKGEYTHIQTGDIAYELFTFKGTLGDGFLKAIEPIAARIPYMNGSNDKVLQQKLWLERVLTEANLPHNRAQRPWIIGLGHRSLYCSTTDNDCVNGMTIETGDTSTKLLELEEILHRQGVDIAFWGHYHYYDRFYPVFNRTISNSSNPYVNPFSTVHILSGSAGMDGDPTPEKFAEPPPPWSAFRTTEFGYTVMNIVNNSHVYIKQINIHEPKNPIDSLWIVQQNHKTRTKDQTCWN